MILDASLLARDTGGDDPALNQQPGDELAMSSTSNAPRSPLYVPHAMGSPAAATGGDMGDQIPALGRALRP
jgi:hypothetical protein